MTTAREWRVDRDLRGPMPAGPDDIAALNQLFSDAFTERYRRDGMMGVRVPQLNPAIWRMPSATPGVARCCGAATGARSSRSTSRTSRDARGGWGRSPCVPNGRAAVSGRRSCGPGVDWLRARGATVIGLETMPRTMDNIGFYSGLGFVPERLTLTLTLDAAASDGDALLLGRFTPERREDDDRRMPHADAAADPRTTTIRARYGSPTTSRSATRC